MFKKNGRVELRYLHAAWCKVLLQTKGRWQLFVLRYYRQAPPRRETANKRGGKATT
jgi:hypothetical protein